ncbi:MAG: GIY-YIG nuclease family protein [Gammaproteobacteria bacterium]|nr:GIY-YIG nuclease family protein [Gammaproteobacteria bacterium]
MQKINIRNYWVYILLCENKNYYTGYTNDLKKRYRSHVLKIGKCKYTRSFKPITIAQCWKIKGDKSFAMKIERYIKTLSREDKQKIILRPSSLSSDSRVETISKRQRLIYISLTEKDKLS